MEVFVRLAAPRFPPFSIDEILEHPRRDCGSHTSSSIHATCRSAFRPVLCGSERETLTARKPNSTVARQPGQIPASSGSGSVSGYRDYLALQEGAKGHTCSRRDCFQAARYLFAQGGIMAYG